MLQSGLIQEFEGARHEEARGQDAIGTGALNRAYEASEGWFFVSGTRERLAASPELAPLAAMAEAEREARVRQSPMAEWVAKLAAAGIGAHRCVADVPELMEDPWAQAHGLSVTRDHAGFGPITTTGPAPRLSRTPPAPGRPAPMPGSDAASILADVGLSDRMEQLVANGVVVVEGVTAR
jgi:crotonobetainyl-CoA:carnitine CoA-transferase CaiB-like acyl-CoA transferase